MILQKFSPMTSRYAGLCNCWKELVGFIFVFMAIVVGGFGSRLYNSPPSLDFFEVFIKEGLLPLVLTCVAVFILLIRIRPQRVEEYRYLNSLPLTSVHIADHLLIHELYRFLWAPTIPIFILWTLTALSPIAHIFRVSIAVYLFYILLLVAFATASFLLSSNRANTLARYNPVLAFFAALILAVGVTSIVLQDAYFSGMAFWISCAILTLLTIFLWLFFRRIFSTWLGDNNLFHTASFAELRHYRFNILPFLNFKKGQPFLSKNMLRLYRENSAFVLMLTVIYILCGYLVSRNNERLEDFVSILLAATVFYALLFSIKSQSYFSESIESRQIAFTLPVKRRELYVSVYLPAVVWLTLITTIFTVLAFASRVGTGGGLLFWVKATGLSLFFVTAALNFAFVAYPNEKKGQTRFFKWGLVLIVLFALFYGYRYYVFLFMLLISFNGIRRVKFYQR